MPWGSYLHTGFVEVKGRRQDVGKWRDATPARVPPVFDKAGADHVRARITDSIVIGSRPTQPPPCHVETPNV